MTGNTGMIIITSMTSMIY